MKLTLDHVIPDYLRHKVAAGKSSIWNQRLQAEQGMKIFIQAPSGAGKTTLVHILYGLQREYSGTVNWDDTDAARADNTRISQLRVHDISIVFQDMRLFPQLTAWENIAIKRRLAGNVTDSTVTGWLEELGIGDKKEAMAATLSYGEQQRVAIIRALVQPFSWLILDEPFSHLDHEHARKAAALIDRRVNEQKAGLILADLNNDTWALCNQTLIL